MILFVLHLDMRKAVVIAEDLEQACGIINVPTYACARFDMISTVYPQCKAGVLAIEEY